MYGQCHDIQSTIFFILRFKTYVNSAMKTILPIKLCKSENTIIEKKNSHDDGKNEYMKCSCNQLRVKL